VSPYPIPLFAMLSIAACAPMGPDPAPPGGGDAAEAGTPPVKGPEPPGIARLPEGECDAAAAQRYVGQQADRAVVQAALEASKARQVRVIEYGKMVTMDFRSDRLSMRLDRDGKIVSIACG
jgi:Peptidase inhibitor I78 family